MMQHMNQSHRKLLSVLLTLSMLLGLLPTMAWALSSKPDDSYDPTAKTGLVYNGNAQVLVNKGTESKSDGDYRYYWSTTSGAPSSTANSYNTIGGGNVTATDAGTYYVYWIWDNDTDRNGSGGDGDFSVTIAKATGSISFDASSITKYWGYDSNSFTKTATNTGDGTVSYSSNNTGVATVNSSTGAVTLVAPGTATITATVADGTNYTYANKTATYTLSVWAQDSTLEVTTSAADLGGTVTPATNWTVNAVYTDGTARPTLADNPTEDQITAYETALLTYESAHAHKVTLSASDYKVYTDAACTAGESDPNTPLTITTDNHGLFYVKSATYQNATGTAEVTVTAYSLTATSENGTVTFTVGTATDPASTAFAGQTVTMTVTPDTGYSIQSVAVKKGGDPVATTASTTTAGVYTFTMPAGDVTATVSYSVTKFAITKSAAENGTYDLQVNSTSLGDTPEAAMDDVVVVSATPSEGYVFDKITVTKTGSDPVVTVENFGTGFVMPDHPVTVSVSFVAKPAESETIAWHNLNDTTNYPVGSTLYTGRYYLTADRTFNGSSTGNGLKIAAGATVYIYLNGHTLSATGKAANGMTGGYAGIYLPSSAKLYFVGDGTVTAVGGNAANGGAGASGTNGTASAHAGGGALGFGGSTSASATAGKGGAGGNGGGGAGAGIGTNGVGGKKASGTTSNNTNSTAPDEAGTVCFLGTVSTSGTKGGDAGTNGGNGTRPGTVVRSKDTAKKLLKNLKASASASGGSGGNGGQGGGAGAAIGSGGYGGGGGAKGKNGTTKTSTSSHDAYNNPVSAATTVDAYSSVANPGTAKTPVQYHLKGINADTTMTNNLFAVGTTITGATNDVLDKLTVKAYYSKTAADTMADYGGTTDTDWTVIDVPQDKINTVTLANQTNTADAEGKIVAGGNNVLVTFDAGSSTGAVTAELNVAGEQTNTQFLGDAGTHKDVKTVKFATYDNALHTLTSLFDFSDSWNATYAVLYTPYNAFKDSKVTNKNGTAAPAAYALTAPYSNANNWLLGGDTSVVPVVENPTFFTITAGNKYFDGDSYETAAAYSTWLGNYADFNKVQVKNAGLYTVYERVLNWTYKADGTYTKTYTYNTYYVLIEQANLGINQATDTVYESTKVGDHRITRFVEGQNSEQVFGTFQFDAGYGELWGNDENLVVNQNAPIQSNLQWEFNVFGNKADNAKDQYTDFDGTTISYGTKNMNNYLCQNDGQSAEDQDVTPGSDVQNTYYQGSNGVLSYRNQQTDPDPAPTGVNVIPAAMTITVNYVGSQSDATKNNAKKDTFTTKALNSEAVTLSTYPKPNYAAKSDDNTLTSIYAEDLKISGGLTTTGIGWRVVVGDKIDGTPAYGTHVTAAPNTAYNADLIDGDAYKGDLYVITVKAGDETVWTQKYTDTTATNTVANVISTLTEQIYDKLPACEYYGVEYYTVTVDYYGLYYTTESSTKARLADWSGQEEFQWVVSGVRFYLDVEQREVTLRNTADFHKVYDGTTKLVSQTLTTDDVTAAAPYVVNIDAANTGTQFAHTPAQSLFNYLDPADTATNKMDLEIAGDYASKDKGAGRSITVAAARFLMTATEYAALSDDVKTARADSRVPVTGDKVAALNYKIVDNDTDATNGVATLTGNVDVAQLHFTHGSYGTLTVYDLTPMHEVFDIHVQAYLLTATADTAGFYSALSMAKTELVEKDDEKGSMTFTTNSTAYDYAIAYAINTTVKYDQYRTDKTLVIDNNTGAVTHVAERSIGSTNPAAFPAMDVTIGSFPNFKLVSPDAPDANLNVCVLQTSIQAAANTMTTSDETWKHEMRFKVKGNGNNYDLLLPVNQLNARSVPSVFVNRSGGTVTDASAAESYKYVNVYPNGDSVQFDFTIPQNSYLEDVKIVAVKVGDVDYKTFNNATTQIPTFATLKADDANVIGTFNTQATVAVADDPATTDVDETVAPGMNNIANPLFLNLVQVNGTAATTLAAPNAQTGGGTFRFELRTGVCTLGVNYAIAVVPVIKAYSPLIEKDDNDSTTTEYAPNLTVEQTITSAADNTLIDGTDDSVYVNYKTLWDTTAVNGTQGTITLSYGTTPTSKTWNLSANTKDEFNSFAIATEADDPTKAFFDPAKLLPGTAVTVTIDLWRNGVVADPQTADDKDAFDTVPFTWTVTQEEYEKLFGDDVVTLRDSSGVLGYSTAPITNFASIATFVTNHASSASTADTAWSVPTGFDALTKYYAEWYTDAGFTAANKVADTSNVTSALGNTFYGKAASSYGGSVSSGTAATITVPVSGNANTVAVSASVSGDTATMKEPTSAELDQVIGQSVETGEVTIDMSGLSSSVATAAIPTATVKAIEAAVAGESNDAESLTVKLPDGSVTFDADALAAIVNQASGSDLKLMVDNVAASTLSAAQQTAVKTIDTQAVYSISLVSGNTVISDFKGGSATVSAPYTLKAGQSARGIVVWYVAGDGTKTEIPATFASGKVTFTVTHFSNYVIAYDAERAASCPQDSTCPISAFADADVTAWYHDGVHWALENGVMNGVGSGKFDPNGTVTRGMVMTMLARMEGVDTTADEGQTWYDKGVAWAMEKGVSDGTNPTAAVTREQFATMLYRYAQYKGVSVNATASLAGYPDAGSVASWASEAMNWLVANGVINGMNGKLNPQGDASRVQIATMLMRYTESVAK